MKEPNKRGREDFENAISDNLETQNFQIVSALGKPRSASEGRLQLDGGFLKNEAIHCYKHKSHCQIEPMKITLPSYCEPTPALPTMRFVEVLRDKFIKLAP